jgi:hypothetical protein
MGYPAKNLKNFIKESRWSTKQQSLILKPKFQKMLK